MLGAMIALALAANGGQLAPAIKTYEVGNFRDAVELFAVLMEDPTLTLEQRATARLYSAAAQLELGQPDLARAQLMLAVRESPDVRPDPAKFVPRFVAMYDEEHARLDAAKAPTPPIEAVAEAPPPTPQRRAFWWAPGVAGLIAAAWGAYFLWRADEDWRALNMKPFVPLERAQAAVSNGPFNLGVGIASVALGAVGILVAAVLFASTPPPVAVVPAPGGAAVAFQGAW